MVSLLECRTAGIFGVIRGHPASSLNNLCDIGLFATLIASVADEVINPTVAETLSSPTACS
jgi:hypothetical protein